jgi:hypothetical protein
MIGTMSNSRDSQKCQTGDASRPFVARLLRRFAKAPRARSAHRFRRWCRRWHHFFHGLRRRRVSVLRGRLPALLPRDLLSAE